MKILCLTSLSWLKNVFKAFRKKKYTFSFITSITSLASINLWRDYKKHSIRRHIDVSIARLTALYYVYFSWNYPIWKLYKEIIFTNSMYLMSEKNKIFHILFHIGVFDCQNKIISIQ
jgi:hypothetical protein